MEMYIRSKYNNSSLPRSLTNSPSLLNLLFRSIFKNQYILYPPPVQSFSFPLYISDGFNFSREIFHSKLLLNYNAVVTS